MWGDRLSIGGAANVSRGEWKKSPVKKPSSPSCAGAPLACGSSRFVLGNNGEPLDVFTYKPTAYAGGPLVVVIHGSDRDAEDHRNWAVAMAERCRALVAAPLFDRERFDDERYKRTGWVTKGGRPQPRDQWTFNIVVRLVAEVRGREGQPALPYSLIGHSGGGQFAVRMALFMADEAKRFVACNPGSYPFPDPAVNYPYGLAGLPAEWASDAALRRFHAAPLTLYLGTGDVLRLASDYFDDSPEAMRQGPERLARGRIFFETSRQLAATRGWTFNWRIVETPGIAHDAKLMFEAPEVVGALFGDGTPK